MVQRMTSHGSWEDSADRVTKEVFFMKVIVDLSLKISSQPLKALEEKYSMQKNIKLEWQAGDWILEGLIDSGNVFRFYSIINEKYSENMIS